MIRRSGAAGARLFPTIRNATPLDIEMGAGQIRAIVWYGLNRGVCHKREFSQGAMLLPIEATARVGIRKSRRKELNRQWCKGGRFLRYETMSGDLVHIANRAWAEYFRMLILT